MEDWPVWATETVELVPADPAWAVRGEHERRDLERRLGPWLVAPVEHVGSTAVAGLTAKPVIDLQAAVADLGCAPAVAAALADGGWHLVPPELDGRPWRRFLVKVVDDRRSAHLHLMTAGTPRWREQLGFRDALRADRRLADGYAALKTELAARHGDDREAYTAAKAAFVDDALRSRRRDRARDAGR